MHLLILNDPRGYWRIYNPNVTERYKTENNELKMPLRAILIPIKKRTDTLLVSRTLTSEEDNQTEVTSFRDDCHFKDYILSSIKQAQTTLLN
jgi:hypothetical protein